MVLHKLHALPLAEVGGLALVQGIEKADCSHGSMASLVHVVE
jgi:hypothetical protein